MENAVVSTDCQNQFFMTQFLKLHIFPDDDDDANIVPSVLKQWISCRPEMTAWEVISPLRFSHLSKASGERLLLKKTKPDWIDKHTHFYWASPNSLFITTCFLS